MAETKKEFTDESIMPFGKHKGKTLANVPDSHLLWLYDNGRMGRLKTYIESNLTAIKKGAMSGSKGKR